MAVQSVLSTPIQENGKQITQYEASISIGNFKLSKKKFSSQNPGSNAAKTCKSDPFLNPYLDENKIIDSFGYFLEREEIKSDTVFLGLIEEILEYTKTATAQIKEDEINLKFFVSCPADKNTHFYGFLYFAITNFYLKSLEKLICFPYSINLLHFTLIGDNTYVKIHDLANVICLPFNTPKDKTQDDFLEICEFFKKQKDLVFQRRILKKDFINLETQLTELGFKVE